MAKRGYTTVSEWLLEHVRVAEENFEHRGYAVAREKQELGFPYAPTFLSKRQRTKVIVEVWERIQPARMEAWTAFARSATEDTRFAVCLPTATKCTPAEEKFIRDQGIGLYRCGEGELVEIFAPKDLAINVSLPRLADLPTKVRKLLGSAYELFDRSQWREGFDDACKILENTARKYFQTGCDRGRIKLIQKGKTVIPSRAAIRKLSLGGLATAFSEIQGQNYTDAIVGKTLDRTNPDRVESTHRKLHLRTEKRLRDHVGHHMWAIIEALKELAKQP
jgi:hypothetical protein